MTPLHCWTSARYTVSLPPGHRFPIAKYALLREAVLASGLVAPEDMHEPERASIDALLLVHTERYVHALIAGELSEAEQRRIGLPWSESLVERSFRAVGGTCEAAAAALERGVTMNLAGGTHHAFPDHGEGFCVFNDVAVAIRLLQRDRRIRRAAVVDLDVHQGNGTHAIFAGDDSVFTFSMHGGRNYPFHKVAGSLDVELADGTGDDVYLAALADALPRVLAAAAPDLVIYLAGADCARGRPARPSLPNVRRPGAPRRDGPRCLSRGRHPGRDHDRRRLRPEYRGQRGGASEHGADRSDSTTAISYQHQARTPGTLYSDVPRVRRWS